MLDGFGSSVYSNPELGWSDVRGQPQYLPPERNCAICTKADFIGSRILSTGVIMVEDCQWVDRIFRY